MLVIDASVALSACAREDGFDLLPDPDLVAPPLLWSEARSVLHEGVWRREVAADKAAATHARLESGRIAMRSHRKLGAVAWRIADDLGWAKTHDAEYVALAGLLECRLVTLDARLHRGAKRLGLVVTLSEL